jgi:hypothetical protein
MFSDETRAMFHGRNTNARLSHSSASVQFTQRKADKKLIEQGLSSINAKLMKLQIVRSEIHSHL